MNLTTKNDDLIASRLSALLKKYEKNPEVIEEIRSKVTMFGINRGIARTLKSKKSEVNLTKEFLKFITTLEKR